MNLRHKSKYIKLLVLEAARDKGFYGYSLLKSIRVETGLPVNPGILYTLLKQMVREGLLSVEENKVYGRRRKIFKLTEKGARYLNENREKLEEARKYLSKLRLAKKIGVLELIGWLLKLIDRLDELEPRQLREIECGINEFRLILNSVLT